MKTTTAVMNAPDMVTSTIGTKNCKNMSEDVMNVLGMGEKRMTYKEASSVIEKYLKCRNEPCIDNRECSYCEYETSWKEQDEAFKLAIESLKCMNLNADMINADAMHKLLITGEMTMEDFRKMCGDVKAIEALSRSEIPNSCHDGDKDINVPSNDCEYCHEDADGYVRPVEKNSHAWLVRRGRTMKLRVGFKGGYSECDILFCPMCGRRLTDE